MIWRIFVDDNIKLMNGMFCCIVFVFFELREEKKFRCLNVYAFNIF